MLSKYDDKKDFVRSLVEEGLTKKEVSEKSGIPYGSISYFLKKWNLKVARNRNKYDHLRKEAEELARNGDSHYGVAKKLGIPESTCYYLFQRWGIVRVSKGRHSEKKDAVEKMLLNDTPVTKICAKCDIPIGSIGFLLEKWGIAHLQLKRRGISFSKEGRESVSAKASARHKALKYMQKDSHPMYGLLKVGDKLVPEEEVKAQLLEFIEQDLTYYQMAELHGVNYKTISNRLRRFGLLQGHRSGARCSWYKGGYEKSRGERWFTKIRPAALERDEYKCQHCGITQEEAYEKKWSLHVHHLIPYRVSQDNSLDNLITLCSYCHSIEERESGIYQYGIVK